MTSPSATSDNAAGRIAEAEKRLGDRRSRRAAWLNMFFSDHGFFRYAYLNLHPVGDKAWRAAQPAPHHIARFKRMGIRTVVNLRGGREFGSYPLEVEACAQLGLEYEEITLKSRDAPKRETLEAAAELLERIEYPAVFHCKSGADRTGLMCALYLMLVENKSPSEAKRALSLRFGHVRQSKTGLLDAFVEAFEADEAAARARGETLGLLEWARTAYDREQVVANFKAQSWATFLSDRLLRRE